MSRSCGEPDHKPSTIQKKKNRERQLLQFKTTRILCCILQNYFQFYSREREREKSYILLCVTDPSFFFFSVRSPLRSTFYSSFLGSGIFVSPKGVLLRSGSVGMTLLVWAGGGFISLLGALSFAELGTLVTKSGGDYIYILEAFRGCGAAGPVPAFLYAWTTCLLLKPASLGITTQSFAKYMLTPFFLYCDDPPAIPTKMLAIWTISEFSSFHSVCLTLLDERVTCMYMMSV